MIHTIFWAILKKSPVWVREGFPTRLMFKCCTMRLLRRMWWRYEWHSTLLINYTDTEDASSFERWRGKSTLNKCFRRMMNSKWGQGTPLGVALISCISPTGWAFPSPLLVQVGRPCIVRLTFRMQFRSASIFVMKNHHPDVLVAMCPSNHPNVKGRS